MSRNLTPFQEDMLASAPKLKAFAISLSGNLDRAEDLVQETLIRAVANEERFQVGTNMDAWLFTILRNLFRSEWRKRRREVEDADGSYTASLKTQENQTDHLAYEDFRRAVGELGADKREALLLVGASGFSYEQAATIAACAVGTIKSRVNRARNELGEKLEHEAPRGKEKFRIDLKGGRAVLEGVPIELSRHQLHVLGVIRHTRSVTFEEYCARRGNIWPNDPEYRRPCEYDAARFHTQNMEINERARRPLVLHASGAYRLATLQ